MKLFTIKRKTPPPKSLLTSSIAALFLLIILGSMQINAQNPCNLGFPAQNTWINQTFDASSPQLTFGPYEDIEIAGTIIVTQGVILTINLCNVYLAPDAKIIVEDGATLHLDANVISACGNQLWDGIYIEKNSDLTAYGNYVTDAKNAFYSNQGGNFEMYSNTFDKCENALTVVNYNGDHHGSYYSNSIMLSQTPLPGGTGIIVGINIENVIATSTSHMLSIGSINAPPFNNNTITDLPGVSIEIHNSDVELSYTDINLDAGLLGINFTGGISADDLRDISINNTNIYTTSGGYTNSQINGYYYYNATITDNNFNAFANYSLIFLESYGKFIFTDNNIGPFIANGLIFENNCISGVIDNNYITYTSNGIAIKVENITNTIIKNSDIYSTNRGTGIVVNESGTIEVNTNTIRFGSAGKGISISNSNIIDINYNTITQNLTSNITTNADRSISVSENCADVDIKNNILTFGNGVTSGIGIYVWDNCFEVDILRNIMYYGAYGVYVDLNNNTILADNNRVDDAIVGMWFTQSDIVEINNNLINQDVGHAIYTSFCNELLIKLNTITMSSSFTQGKTGITVNNSSLNVVRENNINLNGYLSSNHLSVVGITIENSPTTNIIKNTIRNCGSAMYFKSDNNNGIISCNDMHDSYHGMELYNTIFGEFANGDFNIGHPNMPYENEWYNIAVANARVIGTINSSNHNFYYNNTGAAYSLNSGQYSVGGTNIFSSYSTNGQTNFCANQKSSSSIQPITLSTTNTNSIFRDKYIGFAIDTLLLSNSTLSNSNPQGIYSSLSRYDIVKNAYDKYKSTLSLNNLGIASDYKYNSFALNIDASNIGTIYNVNKFIKSSNYQQAGTELQSFLPQNLDEINTYNAYSKYIQKLLTDSLSSQDSSLLYSIANQNPAIGGQSIYIARNILGLYIIDLPISVPTSPRLGNTITDTKKDLRSDNKYIKAYPNPANNIYSIDISGDYSDLLNYEIYSIEGRKLQSGQINNKATNRLDISNINSGIYLLKVFDNQELIFNSKLIIN